MSTSPALRPDLGLSKLLATVAAVLVTALLVAGCGILGGSDDESANDDALTSEADETDANTDANGEGDDSDDETEPDSETSGDLPEGAVADIESLFESEPTNCSFDEIIPLPVAPTCHELRVPEDWNNPDPDDQVVLQIAVFDGDGSLDDPIIYFDGGPGGHTLEVLPFTYTTLIAPQVGQRDFIVFDQRGLGESEPSLHCPELTDVFFEDIAGAIAVEDVAQTTLDAQDECVTRLEASGVNLSAYNSIASANDIEALRLALGYEQLNAIGISYGTRLGQTYMRMYPDSLRSIVLDSVFPVEADLWTNFNPGAERAFEQLFDGCAESTACAEAHPNFEQDFFDLLDQLDAEPIALDLNNFITGQTIPSVIDGNDVMSLVFQALYDRSLFSFVPEMTAAALDGDYSGIQRIASSAATNLGFVSTGMQLSVECNEELPFESAAERDALTPSDPQYERLDVVAGDPDFFGSCEQWPSGAAPDIENETVTSDIPTLLLAGRYDPITPPAGMGTIAAGLTTSYQFTLPYEGHGIAVTECGAEVVSDFIADPDTEPTGDCIAQTTPPDWVPGSEAGPIELIDFELEGIIAIKGARPDGWTDAGLGTFARGQSPVDPTLVIVQPSRGLTLDQVASLLSGQLDVALEDNGTVDIDGETWGSMVGSNSDGQLIELVLSDGPSGVLVVLLANADEMADLRESVLLPMAAAAEPT